ncbi:MAG: transporter [Trichlorobacter sp.]|uniref:transporter n=1 Tax=Trichlorobacter sp. TaxID=2911007 RepID=UPI002565765D|nr:transporter [Trichlorobacter sp.]MDK9719098.1 transporter [Trichlorobacter sp.]
MTALRHTTLALSLTIITTGSAFAGPPLATDDAGTVDVGKVEIELNSSYGYDKHTVDGSTTKTNTAGGEVKITTGLYKDLGISLAIPYLFNERSNVDGDVSNVDGFGDMTMEVKYRFAELAGINLAIKPSVIVPTGKYSGGLSEGRWQFGSTLIATKEFADGAYALHANLGYEYHHFREDDGSQRRNLWSGSIAGEAEVAKGLFAVADFGLGTNPDKTSNDLPVYALTGLRYEINDHLDIDAGIKFGLTRPETDVTALYGLVLKF